MLNVLFLAFEVFMGNKNLVRFDVLFENGKVLYDGIMMVKACGRVLSLKEFNFEFP